MNDLVVVRAALLPSRRHLLLKYLSFCRCCNKLSLLLLSLVKEYLLEVCFGVKLDKLLLDSHKRVEKTRKKISKKNKKFFSLVCSRRSQISRHFHQLSSSLSREKEEVKEEEEEEGEDEKNTEEPQRTTSSLLLEPHLSTRNKSDHAFKRRGVEEATKKLVI